MPAEVERLATLLTPIDDIAVLVDMDVSVFRDALCDQTSDIAKAYRRGKAKCALELRKNDIELAMAGSTTAAIQVVEHLRKMENNETS